ncbi:uncharacterized protein A1O5_00787 [Cladophialophora psammophila CBS 110553]|uniref:Cytochrome P450 oxidoreductase n=1 Tax=Cladophialophora psammophila CBS 110553 TaxID=1182543 RepID=W9Y1B6_9EURO|nr:uncharacterized protein A1O5_00787 [Cladophialophora psammophila CBS 110553]EXJ76279.1 hypothetical protein A1O5_00787 [Cladophialophora psammophila CBS 110553]
MTYPLVGNLLQMPLKNFHLEFQKWANQYGPIMSLKLGGQDMILLNSPEAVRDLIEKRSNIYSARPDLYVREFGDNLNIVLRDNDEVWRRQRKMYHVRLNVKTANNYLPYQIFDSIQLMHDMAEHPSNWVGNLQRYTASIASTVLYGWRTPNVNTGYIKDLIEVSRFFPPRRLYTDGLKWMDRTSAAINLQPVDFFSFLRPWYRVMPVWMSSFKRALSDIQQLENQLFFQLLEGAKERIAVGKKYPSFIRDMLIDKDADRLDDRQIAHNAGHGFGAATDTSWNTLLGFVKAMILFPEVQKKAQEEIDRVIGTEDFPSWEDRARLPYIRGVVEETLRCNPISGAVPHSVSCDDVYKGMKIPKGAAVMMNIWTLNHSTYEDPRSFDPSRHNSESTLNESFGINTDSLNRPHFTFGAGRRVCPGFHVAERALFLAISRLLWGFEFHRAVDSNGQPLPINRDAVTPGFIVRPEAFECEVRPRGSERLDLIKKAWREAQTQLDTDGNFKEEFFQKMLSKKELD